MSFGSTLRLVACAFLFAALPAAAALYKWTDENGRTVYGDTPPPGVKAERINAATPPPDANAVRDMAQKDAEIKKRQQEREDASAKAQKAEADAKAKLERCTQIEGRLKGLKGDAPIYHFNDKGERVYYEPAEREKEINDSVEQMRTLECPNSPAG
jgi:hypothetical protein